MKNKLLYLLLTVLLATVVTACSSGTEETIQEATPTYRADLMLRADAGNGEVTLDWLMDPYAETYNIYVGTSRNSLTKVATGVISAPFTVTQLADGTPLTNGTIYYFSVSGENENGESDLATPITAIPLANPRPLAPENVRANAGNQEVTVTWTPVDGVDGYTVYCIWQTSATDMGGAFVAVDGQAIDSQIVNESTITEWVYNTGEDYLVNGRTYTFWVASIKDGIESSGSFPAYATPTTTPPPMAPVFTIFEFGTFVDGDETYNVKIAWEERGAADSTITDFKVYFGPAKGIRKTSYEGLQELGPNSPFERYIQVEDLPPSESTYYAVITAVNANGESAESNELSAIVP
ncbi:MAG: fibronectin type III domain-containing protein [Smithella sp.]|nr:fibronectin type III domain-containing protein [Smithella sp.]